MRTNVIKFYTLLHNDILLGNLHSSRGFFFSFVISTDFSITIAMATRSPLPYIHTCHLVCGLCFDRDYTFRMPYFLHGWGMVQLSKENEKFIFFSFKIMEMTYFVIIWSQIAETSHIRYFTRMFRNRARFTSFVIWRHLRW